ncbi:MAG: hypothetical protein K2N73_18300 [Lachnospiraceae bacterium]|nr:hypothetical protein [Lachnospiraceae bacterium]
MANNLFIYCPMILLPAVLSLADVRFVCFVVGVLVWGIINFGDHFFYTVKDKKISQDYSQGYSFLSIPLPGFTVFLSRRFFRPCFCYRRAVGARKRK